MKRKDFLIKGVIGLGGVVALTGFANSRKKHKNEEDINLEDCNVSPSETKGPFPNKTPADYVRDNIIGDRKGVPLLITLTILNKNSGCEPLDNALVDIWHCDNQGNYSEYGGFRMQQTDLTQEHFLRGRQTTDVYGRVSFISIFPGYYPGRAPHIHLEVLTPDAKSVLVTQIAFPEDICDSVYASENYQGAGYVSNIRDGIFRNSLDQNMADKVSGNLSDGYILEKAIVVTT
ncbi:protocatechuate 3,4-dioxygenase beta subunit [Saonia flava]|uniref:Protocatechuate 3,4-dioxygenase beta subunit n=1 Tax=Saonia flava TaxID=523696 RepID=A0A846QWQ5_9FLAO|nr:intradiol ring-cleavage dioxygenase [Saonia flava]NJB71370.1 protocatechuate 3,4-dioxygenase beta subunit [Saonia flava]